METDQLDAIRDLSEARAETYLHASKRMVMEHFGPATEHTRTEVSVSLAAAMMQYEGAQLIAASLRDARE